MGGRRMWMAVLAILSLLFAQFVTVAHACTIAFSPSFPAATMAVPMSDCAGSNDSRVNANACEAHCAYGQQIDAHSDAPVVAIAPQPALTVRVPPQIGGRSFEAIALHARSTAPPISILLSRFLI